MFTQFQKYKWSKISYMRSKQPPFLTLYVGLSEILSILKIFP